MTSRTFSLDITCPGWCDESPMKHFDDGMLYHKHQVGKVAATKGQDAATGEDIVTQVEVTIERYDEVTEDGIRLGPFVIRLGGDELYPVAAARELAALLVATADVLDADRLSNLDTTAQVLAEQDAVAEQ